MAQKSKTEASYFLGFDGGGTKTECVLARSDGQIVARSTVGPSNPVRTGYTKAWFALSEAADAVLSREKITAADIRGICAGLGGAGRAGVARRITSFFERGYPRSKVRATTDLEIALEAAFGSGEGILLLAGTGSASFGRDSSGRMARVGGSGPWLSDEGSAFDVGRRAVRAVALAEEHRGPATELSSRIFIWNECPGWELLLASIAKNPDDVFPKTFRLVVELANKGDAVCREILRDAATILAELPAWVMKELQWENRDIPIAKIGGEFGRSKYFDAVVDAEIKRTVPRAYFVPVEISPAEAAVRVALRLFWQKGHAA